MTTLLAVIYVRSVYMSFPAYHNKHRHSIAETTLSHYHVSGAVVQGMVVRSSTSFSVLASSSQLYTAIVVWLFNFHQRPTSSKH
jgi:hypothetical protein